MAIKMKGGQVSRSGTILHEFKRAIRHASRGVQVVVDTVLGKSQDAIPTVVGRSTHRTAIAIIPPTEVWDPIQSIRVIHDRQYARWMPHMNLVYPFLPRAEIEFAKGRVHSVCSKFKPIDITLDDAKVFRSLSHTYSVWLAPEPWEPLVTLQSAVQKAFPECRPSKGGSDYTPHLSIGQVYSRDQLDEFLSKVRSVLPITFRIESISVIRREHETPFELAYQVPLGVEAPPELQQPNVLPTYVRR